MRITESQLKQIISEELQIMLVEEQFRQGLITEEELNEIIGAIKKGWEKFRRALLPYFIAGTIGIGAIAGAPPTVSAKGKAPISQQMEKPVLNEQGRILFWKGFFHSIEASDFMKKEYKLDKLSGGDLMIVIGKALMALQKNKAPSPEEDGGKVSILYHAAKNMEKSLMGGIAKKDGTAYKMLNDYIKEGKKVKYGDL